jgi:uncharacterized protein YukE
MAGFSVDVTALRRAAAEMQAAADQLDDVVGQFAQGLGGVGDPWGTDTLGTLIGGGYVAIEGLALQTYDSVVAAFDDAAEGLTAMADNYAATEEGISSGFTSLEGRF